MRIAALLTALVLVPSLACQAHVPPETLQQPPRPRPGEPYEVRVPFDSVWLHVTLEVPEGEGPHPLVLLNHGSPRTAAGRRYSPRFPVAARWFLQQGWAVAVPARRGYGKSGGEYSEGFGRCDKPYYARAGLATAADLKAVIEYLGRRTDIDGSRVVSVGQSAGGWGSLALTTDPPAGLLGVINVAGGRGSPSNGNNCRPERLVEAARWFGARAKVPSLWVYTLNDRSFDAALSQDMFQNFRRYAKVRSRLIMLPAYGHDGHALFSSKDGPAIWGPHVAFYLKELSAR